MIKKDNKRIIITLTPNELEALKELSYFLGFKTYSKAIKHLISMLLLNRSITK